MEKIGQVLLDDTLYPGKDLYTDGAIEDEMLEIARNYREEEWNQVIAERASWPILIIFLISGKIFWAGFRLPEKKMFSRSVPDAVRLPVPSVRRQSR